MTIFLSLSTLLFMSGFGYFAYRAYILAGILADQQEYTEQVELTNNFMYSKIEESYSKMQEIDRLGAFEKDDESGTTFQLLKQTIDELKAEFDGTQEEN
jgi:hypothetical protein